MQTNRFSSTFRTQDSTLPENGTRQWEILTRSQNASWIGDNISLMHIFSAQHITLLFVASWNVHIKSVLGVVFFSTVWAVIREAIREVDCLQVVLSVPSAATELHAECARETAGIKFWQESVEVLGTLYRSRWNRTRDTKCPNGPLSVARRATSESWTGCKWEEGMRKGLPLFPSAPPAVAIIA